MSGGAPTAAAARPMPLADVVELTKPRITLMVLITATGGFALAPGAGSLVTLAFALAGTAMMVGAANAFNMYLERDSDAFMARTRNRPLPTGRLDPIVARAVGGALALVGAPLLTFAVNPLTGALGVFAFLSYVLVYTPMKRRTSAAIWIGAVPGAMGPLMGWTAATGALDVGGLALFAVLFLWQVPHFHAIALFRTEEYRAAGLKTLPGERGPEVTRRAIIGYLALQIAVTFSIAPLGLAGLPYTIAAAVLGAAYFSTTVTGWRARGVEPWARRVFFASLLYLPLLFGALILDGRF